MEPQATPLILVSASPRRRRLLAWLGVPFQIASVQTPEDLSSPLAANPPRLAESLAEEKAFAARDVGLGEKRIVLCFDTLVVLDGEVLGKPEDVEDAWRMLRTLSGREHEVITGVSILCPDEDRPRTFSVATRVRMRDLSDDDIRDWMARGEFMGCAGAYNIEGQVAEVAEDECYQNVAGIPLCHLYRELSLLRDTPCTPPALKAPVGACDAALQRRCRLGPVLADK